jgi:hypothetical protein
MKSLLIAMGIAALTTPANARPWAGFYCGKSQIALIPGKYFDPYFKETCGPCDAQNPLFRYEKGPRQQAPAT